MSNESKDLVKKGEQALSTERSVPMGFEDENQGDMIIPRIKVIQTLSPEKKDKTAEEGDILNSLTKEKLNGRKFIPVFKFDTNIDWKDRSEGGGIKCYARDGKVGVASDGTQHNCKACGRNEFDNTKQGKEALPKCTKYFSFFGFIEGDRIPIVLSFSKTNYNEGKKLFSLAKVTMQNMWHYGYSLTEKLMAKAGNEWFNIVVTPAGPTSDEDRAYAAELYKMFRTADLKIDMDDDGGAASTDTASKEELNSVEY